MFHPDRHRPQILAHCAKELFMLFFNISEFKLLLAHEVMKYKMTLATSSKITRVVTLQDIESESIIID